MKKLFALLTIVVYLQSQGQDLKIYKRDSAWISNSKINEIELRSNARTSFGNRLQMPFNRFVINDVRPDTTSIGVSMVHHSFSEMTNAKLTLKNKVQGALMRYLNEESDFDFSTAGTLSCYIKHLRIAEIDSIDKATRVPGEFYRLRFEAEGYLTSENNSYPAIRLDTTIVSDLTKNKATLLADVLDVFSAKAAMIDTEKVFKRNALRAEDVDNRYRMKFRKPVLLAENLTAGVYKTLNEFINNQPFTTEYDFKKEKKVSILYTKTNGSDWAPERKAFGFCDGKVIWINVKNSFYPLVRQGNTFEFIANYYIVDEGSGGSSAVVLPNNSLPIVAAFAISTAISNPVYNKWRQVIYQLNMENGSYD
jgi:hypothetical protein